MPLRLRPSRYTIVVPRGSSPPVLFNAATGLVLELSDGIQAAYNAVLREESVDTEDEAVGDLRARGFVVADDVDELMAVKMAFDRHRSGIKTPHLTIAPTLDCNFGCEYCFETHRRGAMTSERQAALVRLAHRMLSIAPSSDLLTVEWFGGEPLLAMPVIRNVSKEFMALRDSGAVKAYQASIVTNGSLAGREVVEELLSLDIRHAQITIDGDQACHDSRRVLKGRTKGPTFARIISNLQDMPEEMAVTIRVNTDRRNAGSIVNLMAQLEAAGLLRRVHVNISPVEPFREHEVLAADHVLTSEEFAALENQLSAMAAAEGWPMFFAQVRPVISGYCQVDHVNSFVVGPTGDLMKCWAELGNEPHVVGRLDDESTWDKLLPTDLTERDPFDDQECNSCRILPLCMGACPIVRKHRRAFGKKQCPPLKYNLEESLARQFANPSTVDVLPALR